MWESRFYLFFKGVELFNTELYNECTFDEVEMVESVGDVSSDPNLYRSVRTGEYSSAKLEYRGRMN